LLHHHGRGIDAKVLQAALNEAVANSFNRITVDGDMSTNDTVLVLANGLAGNKKFTIHDSKFGIFQAALNHVCLELAKKLCAMAKAFIAS
jgi:glutamate N-acetyltransferase / amino-acid N-acetyltransferase